MILSHNLNIDKQLDIIMKTIQIYMRFSSMSKVITCVDQAGLLKHEAIINIPV